MLPEEYKTIQMKQLCIKKQELLKSKENLQSQEVQVDIAMKDCNSLLVGVQEDISELDRKGVKVYEPPKEDKEEPESGQAKPVGD